MSGGRLWNASSFRPAASAPAGTVFHCGLCGAHFTHGEQVCGACPLESGCLLVRCPSCGYQFPRESSLVAALRRLRDRWRKA